MTGRQDHRLFSGRTCDIDRDAVRGQPSQGNFQGMKNYEDSQIILLRSQLHPFSFFSLASVEASYKRFYMLCTRDNHFLMSPLACSLPKLQAALLSSYCMHPALQKVQPA